VANSCADGPQHLANGCDLRPANLVPATHLANALSFTIQFKCDSMCESCVANAAIGCRRVPGQDQIPIQIQMLCWLPHCCHQKIVEKIENIRVRVSIKMGKFSTVNGRPIELRINSLKAIRTSKIPLAISSFHFALPSFHC